MNKFMDDMIIKLYELNERYHDTKEKMAWLGSSLYFAFSLAILRILFIKGMQKIIEQGQWVPWVIGILLASICGCAVCFICLQYRKKRISVGISNEFMDIVSNYKLYDESVLKEMLKITKDLNSNWGEYKKNHKKECKKYRYAELPVYILISVFLASQIILIWYKSKY